MFLPTAAASIAIRTPDYTPGPTSLSGSEISWVPSARRLSDSKPEQLIYITAPVKPQWFASVQMRLRRSVKPNSRADNDPEWISQEVADAGNAFFEKTADILPGEPFIYRSSLGDLVAEFRTERGAMTTVVSPGFLLLFAVIDGKPIERQVPESGDVRAELQELSSQLRMDQHGAMDTAA